jgi:hypothetical protein
MSYKIKALDTDMQSQNMALTVLKLLNQLNKH